MVVVLINYVLCASNCIFSICYTTLTLINHLKIYKTYLVNTVCPIFLVQTFFLFFFSFFVKTALLKDHLFKLSFYLFDYNISLKNMYAIGMVNQVFIDYNIKSCVHICPKITPSYNLQFSSKQSHKFN